MIINIRVIPKSSRKFVKKEGDCIKAYLTRPAQGGLANAQLIELLADYLGVRKYQIRIVKGEKARCKLVEVSDDGR
ncbi:DUF167 domain-containing protein [bacterium]|nr:MAG: DUF167 domain-containing protein [bacterium]